MMWSQISKNDIEDKQKVSKAEKPLKRHKPFDINTQKPKGIK